MAAQENADAFTLVGEATFPTGPQALGAARSAITVWLDGHATADVRDDACLLASELISNSVRHSRMPSGTPLHVTAAVLDGTVRVVVTDQGHGGAIVRREPDRFGGYGLNLLHDIAVRWGVDRSKSTQVWFELAAAPV
jgi:anti-sigma regulatory factor (Ser/Thr protein kinase)